MLNAMVRKFDYMSIVLQPNLWRNWWRTWRTLPVWTWIAGAYYFRDGDYRKASACYKKGLKRYFGHKAADCAKLDYAYCLYRLGDWFEAREQLYELIYEGDKLQRAYILLARIEVLIGQPNAAVQVLEAGRTYFPNNIEIITRLTYAIISDGKAEESYDAMRAGLAQAKSRVELNDPDMALVDTAICALELARGNKSYGRQILSRVIATGSAPVEAILIKGKMLLQLGRILQARRLLSRALELSPRDPRASLLIARSYLHSGPLCEPEWAIQMAELACKLTFWQNSSCMQVLAYGYKMAGRKDSYSLLAERIKVLKEVRGIDLDALRHFESNVKLLQSIGEGELEFTNV